MSAVALYGGSFDPPHIGHQVACLMVLELTSADALWLLPTWRHALGKEACATFDQRAAMCRLMAAPLGERVSVSLVEGELGGAASRTLDTLAALEARHPQNSYRLIVGADILAEHDRWHRWDEIVRRAPPIVIGRAGWPGGTLPAPPEVSSAAVRELLGKGESATRLVSRSVLDYIAREELYT